MSQKPAVKQLVRELVGRNIVRAREEAGLSQWQLAERLGQSQPVLSTWEHGRRKPDEDNLLALADALGHDIGWFFTQHDEPVDE